MRGSGRVRSIQVRRFCVNSKNEMKSCTVLCCPGTRSTHEGSRESPLFPTTRSVPDGNKPVQHGF